MHVVTVKVLQPFLHNADPNGNQSRQFDWEGQPCETISLLFTAAMQRRPHLVKMRLQAHADPNECGYEKDFSGEAVSPEVAKMLLIYPSHRVSGI